MRSVRHIFPSMVLENTKDYAYKASAISAAVPVMDLGKNEKVVIQLDYHFSAIRKPLGEKFLMKVC